MNTFEMCLIWSHDSFTCHTTTALLVAQRQLNLSHDDSFNCRATKHTNHALWKVALNLVHTNLTEMSSFLGWSATPSAFTPPQPSFFLLFFFSIYPLVNRDHRDLLARGNGLLLLSPMTCLKCLRPILNCEVVPQGWILSPGSEVTPEIIFCSPLHSP
jgi:hypothetical protein